LFAQANVGIGTALPMFNLHIQVPYAHAVSNAGTSGIAVSSHMPTDGVQADVAFHLVNTAIANSIWMGFSKWSLWHADPDGGYGVLSNGWEIWEYPPGAGSSCCRPRFRVLAGSSAGNPAFISPAQECYAYDFITYSDERAKQEVVSLHGGLESAKKLRPVRYLWKDTQTEQIGFIAQEVGEHMPSAQVLTADSLQGVDYVALTAVLVKAVQELSEKVTTLERRKEALEARRQKLLKNKTSQNKP
ncbi:MAG: tail fiber domain-containing protein, partial [Bacteroidia bacterium]|nr:tail fiber domain-containing protein [Bacteroidia bacterium]